MSSYLTLAGPGEAETRVLGSRFLALAFPVHDESDARTRLAARERDLFDASHHCSAWRLHGGTWRTDDAGEPGGSAGAPILAAIDGAGLEDCAVVVTRYFGGTRLGVGGLVRAYGEAARIALQAAPCRWAVPALRLRIRYPYEHTAAVMRAIERSGGEELEHGFAADGVRGELTLTIPESVSELMHEAIRDQTAGAVIPECLGRRVMYRSSPQ